ncbi:polyketide synthase [Micromonospora sp. ATCC 39149]|nr:polyketide synthase [Micromonospora sp. ATCC 39149]
MPAGGAGSAGFLRPRPRGARGAGPARHGAPGVGPRGRRAGPAGRDGHRADRGGVGPSGGGRRQTDGRRRAARRGGRPGGVRGTRRWGPAGPTVLPGNGRVRRTGRHAGADGPRRDRGPLRASTRRPGVLRRLRRGRTRLRTGVPAHPRTALRTRRGAGPAGTAGRPGRRDGAVRAAPVAARRRPPGGHRGHRRVRRRNLGCRWYPGRRAAALPALRGRPGRAVRAAARPLLGVRHPVGRGTHRGRPDALRRPAARRRRAAPRRRPGLRAATGRCPTGECGGGFGRAVGGGVCVFG